MDLCNSSASCCCQLISLLNSFFWFLKHLNQVFIFCRSYFLPTMTPLSLFIGYIIWGFHHFSTNFILVFFCYLYKRHNWRHVALLLHQFYPSADRRSQVFRHCWDYISTEIPDHRTDLCIYDLVRSNHFLVLVTSRLLCEYLKHPPICIMVFRRNPFSNHTPTVSFSDSRSFFVSSRCLWYLTYSFGTRLSSTCLFCTIRSCSVIASFFLLVISYHQ